MALAFYYLAISFLVACVIVIVVKLIFWPPCTQIGNTCAIDPWSTAGLAGTVLAVSATVLAILGAVAVAAWWTSLNATVTERVRKLYKKQQREVNTQVDTMLSDQREKVNDQIEGFQKAFRSFEGRIYMVRRHIDELHQSTQDVEEMAVDGITSVFGADFLEQWAQKATQNQKFPRITMRMAESYLNAVEHRLASAEEELVQNEKFLGSRDDVYRNQFLHATYAPCTDQYAIPSLQNIKAELKKQLDSYTTGYTPLIETLANWDGAERWLSTAVDYLEIYHPEEDEFALPLKTLKERAAALRPRVEQLKQKRDQLMAQTEALIAKVHAYAETGLKGPTSNNL